MIPTMSYHAWDDLAVFQRALESTLLGAIPALGMMMAGGALHGGRTWALDGRRLRGGVRLGPRERPVRGAFLGLCQVRPQLVGGLDARQGPAASSLCFCFWHITLARGALRDHNDLLRLCLHCFHGLHGRRHRDHWGRGKRKGWWLGGTELMAKTAT